LLTLADNKTHNTRFVGYFNQPKLSQAKLVQNVLVKDDIYMRTGDLLYKTPDQYWYFADRAGDTYRWKGENVSTAEIADSMGRIEGVASCTVYGVSVPGQDGRAGMAALVLKDPIIKFPSEATGAAALVDEAALEDFIQRLGGYVAKSLPSYAVPRFIRVCEQELETTGTFKNKKVELKKEGFDLKKIKERMYWWTPQGRYLPFGEAENQDILEGRARL
jgi:acyl-CoA synthetase (AMP-forming)/AMP-acid ligase II